MILGMFVESHTGQNVLVTLKMYAHRSLPQLMVTELLVRNDQDVPLRVDLGIEAPTVTDDLDEKVSGDKTTASDKDRR